MVYLRYFLLVDVLRTDNHFAHQFGHDGLSLVGCLLHLLVAYLYWLVEATQVGDDADTKDADAAVVGHDDLGHGGHAYSVATQEMVHLVFSGSLEGGSLNAEIDAVVQADALLSGYRGSQLYEFRIVGGVHVGESRACGEVLSTQWVLREEVDVVGDDHDVANLEGGVHAAGGVGDEECLYAHFIHDTNGERHLFHRVALIVVEASLHGHDVHATQFAEDQLAAMAFDGGNGEVGNFLIGNLQLISYF